MRNKGTVTKITKIQEKLAKIQDMARKFHAETKGTKRENSVWNDIYDELHGLILRLEASK